MSFSYRTLSFITDLKAYWFPEKFRKVRINGAEKNLCCKFLALLVVDFLLHSIKFVRASLQNS